MNTFIPIVYILAEKLDLNTLINLKNSNRSFYSLLKDYTYKKILEYHFKLMSDMFRILECDEAKSLNNSHPTLLEIKPIIYQYNTNKYLENLLLNEEPKEIARRYDHIYTVMKDSYITHFIENSKLFKMMDIYDSFIFTCIMTLYH